jgi:hypothetical protein
MLTVNALNSTMSSVLGAIRAKTGIQFDGAENSSERVAVNLGPAPEGDVLAGIFSGSGFDYVVLGRPDSPGTVQRVILTPRARGGAGAVAGQPQQPMQPPQAQAQAQQEGDEEVTNDDAADQEPQPQDAPVQPPPVQQPPTTQNQQIQNNEQPKTPEQLLEELKQMQLQQQQQQGQPPPDTNSVPRKMPPR